MNPQHKFIFSQFVEKDLNNPQREAVTLHKGALLVVAGAGSGKTRVITARIAHLILHENVYPSSIVALTFTNKAAGEMRERLVKFLGPQQSLPFVGTFHSYCLMLLRNNAHLLPYPQFTILDGEDQTSLLKKIIKHNALEKFATPSQLIFQISTIKNKIFMGDDEDLFPTPMIKEIYYAYEKEKASARAYDFDDLIVNVLKLFEEQEPFRRRFQERIKHLLVDEYQDTSHTQHALLKAMALDDDQKFILDSVCAVGDEDQSIYSWRGATVANMLKFQKDFEPVTRIKIEQNYRSVQPILHAANSLIKNNRLRNPKELWSHKQAENRILRLASKSGEQEADAIARLLKTFGPDKKLNNVALLYRTHFQSRALEEAFLYHAIPYKIVGGIRFYERKEIKDVLAYLRLVVNPFDKISFLRVINYPSRGLGDKFEEQFMAVWDKNPFLDFKQILGQLMQGTHFALSSLKKAAVQNFLAIFDGLDKGALITKVADAVLGKTDYLNYLRTTLDARESDTKVENVRELLQAMMTFERSALKTSQNPIDTMGDPFNEAQGSGQLAPTLESFLHEVSLMQEKFEDTTQTDQVQMMTLHAAKGLEFDLVIIAGAEEGLLPSSRSLTTNEALEEERRLFYVGITRACEHLIISHASSRSTYGNVTDQIPSRFAEEIDQSMVQVCDIDKMPNGMITSKLRHFIGLSTASSSTLTFFQSIAQDIQSKQGTEKTFTGSVKTSEQEQSPKSWFRNQQVAHKSFGKGIVIGVESASGNDFYITAIFKEGKKKVLSTFLEPLN